MNLQQRPLLVIGGSEGLPVCTDDQRKKSDFNARGYFEDERVKTLRRDNRWLCEIHGQAVKIIAPLLNALPLTPKMKYGVILMERSIQDVLSSQQKMLVARKRTGSELSDERINIFLAGSLDTQKMVQAVDPELQHECCHREQ